MAAGLPFLVPLQSPAAGHDDAPAIPPGMRQFTLPLPLAEKLGFQFPPRLGKLRAQEFIGFLPLHLGLAPAIGFLGPGIPEDDAVVQVPDDNSIVGQVQKFGLPAQLLLGPLARGDIGKNPHVADNLAVGIQQRRSP